MTLEQLWHLHEAFGERLLRIRAQVLNSAVAGVLRTKAVKDDVLVLGPQLVPGERLVLGQTLRRGSRLLAPILRRIGC